MVTEKKPVTFYAEPDIYAAISKFPPGVRTAKINELLRKAMAGGNEVGDETINKRFGSLEKRLAVIEKHISKSKAE